MARCRRARSTPTLPRCWPTGALQRRQRNFHYVYSRKTMTDMTPNPTPKRVLIVAPHPDDAEFMAGGTMARWARSGAYVHFLLVTDGISGSRDPNQTHAQLAEIRHEEQREAARRLGAHDVTFLGYHDGRLEPSIELRFAIARVIRQLPPDVLVAGAP